MIKSAVWEARLAGLLTRFNDRQKEFRFAFSIDTSRVIKDITDLTEQTRKGNNARIDELIDSSSLSPSPNRSERPHNIIGETSFSL